MELLASEKIVICKNPSEGKTKSGLLYSQDDKNKPEIGVVVKIGKGDLPVEFAVGDTVVFRRYTDNRIFIEGREYNFVDFKDVMGVVRNE